MIPTFHCCVLCVFKGWMISNHSNICVRPWVASIIFSNNFFQFCLCFLIYVIKACVGSFSTIFAWNYGRKIEVCKNRRLLYSTHAGFRCHQRFALIPLMKKARPIMLKKNFVFKDDSRIKGDVWLGYVPLNRHFVSGYLVYIRSVQTYQSSCK